MCTSDVTQSRYPRWLRNFQVWWWNNSQFCKHHSPQWHMLVCYCDVLMIRILCQNCLKCVCKGILLYVLTVLAPCQLEETLQLSRVMHRFFYRMSEQNDFLLLKGQTSCAFCYVTLNNMRSMLEKRTRRQRLGEMI